MFILSYCSIEVNKSSHAGISYKHVSHARKKSQRGHEADLRLGTGALVIQECLLKLVSPIPDPDCFGIARQS